MKNDEGWKCSYLSSIRPRNFYHINMPMPSAAICVLKEALILTSTKSRYSIFVSTTCVRPSLKKGYPETVVK